MNKYIYDDYAIDGLPFYYNGNFFCYIHDLELDPFVCMINEDGLRMAGYKYYDLHINNLNKMIKFIIKCNKYEYRGNNVNKYYLIINENTDDECAILKKRYRIAMNERFIEYYNRSYHLIGHSFSIDNNGYITTNDDRIINFMEYDNE